MTINDVATHRLGAGEVSLDRHGHLVQVTRGDGRPMLLDECTEFDRVIHGPASRFGTGLLVWHTEDDTLHGWRWHRDDPDAGSDRVDPAGASELTRTFHSPRRDLALHVTTALHDDEVRQRYEVVNRSDQPVTVTSWGITVPFRDTYLDAADSLRRAVHAHVWTGGSDSYLWAAPMDGSGPGLGVTLTEGALWCWSVEARDAQASSNLRGRLVVHATDAARHPSPDAGPMITLAPGASHALGWRIAWYDDLDHLHRTRQPLVVAEDLSATAGTALPVTVGDGVTAVASGHGRLVDQGGRTVVVADRPGEVEIRATRQADTAPGPLDESVTRLLFHPPLNDVVRRRCRWILDHHVYDGARFVPVDGRTGLQLINTGWRDWNDLREREAMPLLLQIASRTGRLATDDEDRCHAVLAAHAAFLRERVVDAAGHVADDADLGGTRLYNSPWFARFFLERHASTQAREDLELSTRIIEAYYHAGGDHFLAFGLATICRRQAARWRALGDTDRADRLVSLVVGHARTVLGFGQSLPKHEVNYEQSMVAPMVDLLAQAHELDPDAVPADEVAVRVGWLAAFAGDQPDVRLRHVPIRHWDGYWFGLRRQWGDVFPHYWSVLSSDAFLALPEGVVPDVVRIDLRRRAVAVLRSNLIAFRDDGWATCAHVRPSAVNGLAAHGDDPLANDQDWALVYALEHAELLE